MSQEAGCQKEEIPFGAIMTVIRLTRMNFIY